MGFWWADGTGEFYEWETTYKNKNRPRAYTYNRKSYSWNIVNCDKDLLE